MIGQISLATLRSLTGGKAVRTFQVNSIRGGSGRYRKSSFYSTSSCIGRGMKGSTSSCIGRGVKGGTQAVAVEEKETTKAKHFSSAVGVNKSNTATATIPASTFTKEKNLSTAAAVPVYINDDEEDVGVAGGTEATFSSNDDFPSIVIGHGGKVEPHGSFAEAQAKFLDPDPEIVDTLVDKLSEANMGIVAHYYMDVELQGTLQAIGRRQAFDSFLLKEDAETLDPSKLEHEVERIESRDINTLDQSRVSIADSLAMGDHAVRMCRDLGVTSIMCLGVDFMSESVQAILNQNGYGHVPVYRATSKSIGCSLAESAERDSYRAWLQMGSSSKLDPSLHVVYINTSLETKAISNSIMPTITCTSSNVLKTILQASYQIGPNLKLYYGPDTYMGDNLVSLLDSILSNWTNERIQQDLHPNHTLESIQILRDNMNIFPNGNCVVHHMFGTDVVNRVLTNYQDAYVTAHLEVPGEMFHIAMEHSMNGDKGVVGSTSDILKFIARKVKEAAASSSSSNTNNTLQKQRLKFVLGTEAGMVTSIVRAVSSILESSGRHDIEAEIIFPVASDAVTAVSDSSSTNLSVVPGVSGGEGCSTAGGCATCPFMKMNDLDSLENVIDMVLSNDDDNKNKASRSLQKHLPPKRLDGKLINGRNAIDYGVEPIQYMRQFMKDGELPSNLVNRIVTTKNKE